jgi:hypothetical protein
VLAILLLMIALPTFAATPGGLSAKERDKATPTATETSTPEEEQTDPTATATSEPTEEKPVAKPTSTKAAEPDKPAKSAKTTESQSMVASGPLAFPSTADAWAEEANPSANYGTTASVKVDAAPDPAKQGFMKFEVTGVSGRVTAAHLRLYVMAATATGPSIATVNNDWSETSLTWNTRPPVTGVATEYPGAIAENAWVEFDVTNTVTANGVYSFVITGNSSDGVDFSARERPDTAPQLVLTVDSSAGPVVSPTPLPPSNQVTPTTIAPTSTAAPKTATAAPANTLALRSLSVQSVIRAGGYGKITVCLSGVAPRNGASVSLNSNRPSILPVPATVLVPAGKSCLSTNVKASNISREVAVNITAQYGGARITKGTVVRPMSSTPTATAVASPSAGATMTATPSTSRTPTATATRTPAPSATAKPGPTGGDPIRAMFYYPWFPEAWKQSGIYPYTNFHPSAGFYDGTDPAVIRSQIDAMQYGGIQLGISSWWGQGHRTDTRLPLLLSAASGTGFTWSIYHEQEGQGDPSVDQIRSDLTYIRDKYASDPSYLKINGKFVVFVYAQGSDGCGMADRWTQANTVGAYVVLKVFSGYKTCTNQPDGWHQYGPAVAASDQAPYSYSISPGFWKVGEQPRLERDLNRWNQNIRDMIASGAQFQLVVSFNEWGEGTGVESTTEWASSSGYGAYLDALHNNGGGTPAQPTPAAPAPTQPATVTPAPTKTASVTPAPTKSATATPIPPASSGDSAVLYAAGDIVSCDRTDDEAVSKLLDNTNGTIAVLGDNVYESGTAAEYANCYDPSWGRHKARTRPAVGNHEYLSTNAAPYFAYFGAAAGDPTKGYYSYDLGDWHVVVLNSNCSKVKCDPSSAQYQWLQSDLKNHPNSCTLAYYHHPAYSSGVHGNNASSAPLWQALYAGGVELVLNGHDHIYERFAPMDGNGNRDTTYGMREFIVGTGGKNHTTISAAQPNSEVRNTDTFGVLRLTLHSGSYEWQFVPVPGKTFGDSGTGKCHSAPASASITGPAGSPMFGDLEPLHAALPGDGQRRGRA